MKFHLYQDTKGEIRWRLVARNGRIMADSAEGYSSWGAARGAIERIAVELGVQQLVIVRDEPKKPARRNPLPMPPRVRATIGE